MGKLYAMLHKLENNQWVKSTVTQEGNRPQRTQYQITALGRTVFNEWLYNPVRKGRDFRIVFLLKMYFVLKDGEENAQRLIAVQQDACRKWLEEFQQGVAIQESTAQTPDFNQIVINFRITQIKGYLEWLDWCKKHIKKEKGTIQGISPDENVSSNK
jgi:DNA-binding PadR family transcriptional regulator